MRALIGLCCSFGALFFSISPAIASNSDDLTREIKGYVIESGSNVPLKNVAVNIAGQSTITDEHGYFLLNLPNSQLDGASLQINQDCYRPFDIKIKKLQNFYNIQLIPNHSYLEEVVVNSTNLGEQISKLDLAITPVNTAQDVLRKVLGLFLAQHQGGGKAEQIFLRGFDNDHGTDIAIYSDGMPANVVSHAHGQGYADLHFIIPEVIQSIAYNKGSYYIKRGDFNTSGYVNLNTFKRLPQSMIKVEGGNYSTVRVVGMVNLLPHKITNQNAYAAVEYNYTNGPFEIPQNFSRLNAFFKYNIQLKKTFINLQASSFT